MKESIGPLGWPVNHKTVFVLDHSPFFSMACDLIEFDSLKSSLGSQQQQPIPVAPVAKTMWTSASESVMEYCRVVWDIFPPDCGDSEEQKLIRLVVSDAAGDSPVLTSWNEADQNPGVFAKGLALVGRPEPESRRKSSATKGYNILNGMVTALKVLCEPSQRQRDAKSRLVNRGRVVVLTHLEGGDAHLRDILTTFQQHFFDVNQVAATSDVLVSVSSVELVIVHCFPGNQECRVTECTGLERSMELTGSVKCQVVSVPAGMTLSRKLLHMCLMHYDLASTTVTGIPMKEEQNAFSSANYDVELFHKASAHSKLLNGSNYSGSVGSCTDLVQNMMQQQQTRRGSETGDMYSTITLKWCTPRGSPTELHVNCVGATRITPTDVNSRPSSCLTNFLLNSKSVMLEMPRRGGSKILSHILTSHAGEIFIHTLNISRSILEDPPSISEGPGGRVTDYRIPDMVDVLKRNRLFPYRPPEGLEVLASTNTPMTISLAHLSRCTQFFPLTIGATTIFNMATLEPLQRIMCQETLSEQDLADCQKIIYHLLSMENRGDPLPIPMQQQMAMSTNKIKTPKKEDQYRMMFDELEAFVASHCRTPAHHRVLACLLEVAPKVLRAKQRHPTPTPRPTSLRNGGGNDETDAIKKDTDGTVELDVALRELDKFSAMTEREKSDFNLSNDGVLRSNTHTPMSPTSTTMDGASSSVGGADSAAPPAKKPKFSTRGPSLLDIWTERVEKENLVKHLPFAGQRSLGDKAKLYLSLERVGEKDAVPSGET